MSSSSENIKGVIVTSIIMPEPIDETTVLLPKIQVPEKKTSYIKFFTQCIIYGVIGAGIGYGFGYAVDHNHASTFCAIGIGLGETISLIQQLWCKYFKN